MIHVIAVITAKPGLREQVLEAFRANVPAVLAEAGCIEYGAAVDVGDGLPTQAKYGADAFVVIEKWETMDALKAHAKAPHMAAYTAKTMELARLQAAAQATEFVLLLSSRRAREVLRKPATSVRSRPVTA